MMAKKDRPNQLVQSKTRKGMQRPAAGLSCYPKGRKAKPVIRETR